MKGKLDIRFAMPNVGRVRSRVEKPSKELSAQLRAKLAEIVAEQLNVSTLVIRAKFIDYVKSLNLKYKSDAHQKQVFDATNSLFDTIFAKNQAELDAIVGDEKTDEPDEGDKGANTEGTQDPAKEEAPADENPGDSAAPANAGDNAPDDFE